MTSPQNTQFEPDFKPKPRYIYFLMILTCLLIIVGAGFASFFLVDNFREPIAKGLSRATGLTIRFDSIGLSFSHGLGLRCGGVTVHSANGKKNLFSAEKFIVEVEFQPLIHKQIVIKSSTLVNPVFPIYLGEQTKEIEPSTEQVSGTHPQNLPAEMPAAKQTPLEKVRTFLKSNDLTLQDISVENGKIQLLRSSNHPDQQEQLPLRFSFKFNALRPSQDRIDITLTAVNLGLGSINLSGDVFIDDLMQQGATLRTDIRSQSFTDSDINAIKDFFAEPIRQGLDQRLVTGKVHDLSIKADLPIESVKDIESIANHAHARLTFAIDEGGLDKQAISIPHSEFDLTWANNQLSHSIRGNALDGEFHLMGTILPASNFAGETDIELEGIGLNKIKLPIEWTPTSGLVSGKLHLSFSGMDHPKVKGDLYAKKIIFGASANNNTAESASIKIQTLDTKQTSFDVILNEITLGKVRVRQSVGTIHASKEEVQLRSGKILPGHGQINFTGNYFPDTQTYNLQFAGKKLSAEDLLPEHIAGPLELDGNLIQGKYAKHPLRGLSGSMHIKLADGNLHNLGLLTPLLSILNPQSVVSAEKQGLPFTHLGGFFKIDRGNVTTADMELKGSQLNLLAVGKVDLVTDNIKGEIKAMPLQLVDTVTKIIPLLGKYLAKKGGLETYFSVEGSLSNPKFNLLSAKSLIGKPVQVLEESIKLP